MSSQQILKVRPTKIELIRLRRRLKLAKRIHRILRERLTILVAEFLNSVRQVVDERRELIKLLEKGYANESLIRMFHSSGELENIARTSPKLLNVYVATKNIMGVRTPFIDYRRVEEYEELKIPVSLGLTSIPLEVTRKIFAEILEKALELAEHEKTLDLLSKEIMRTRRRVNILEHVIIPRLEATIKYLEMMFDEREREEKTRLKRVKAVLSRRRKE